MSGGLWSVSEAPFTGLDRDTGVPGTLVLGQRETEGTR